MRDRGDRQHRHHRMEKRWTFALRYRATASGQPRFQGILQWAHWFNHIRLLGPSGTSRRQKLRQTAGGNLPARPPQRSQLKPTSLLESRGDSIMNASQLLQHAHEIVSNCSFCFVSSIDASGQINSRVVEILEVEQDLSIRFMTDSRTRKASEIRQGKTISLSFLSMADGGYVTIGTAPIVSGETALKQRIWKESLRRWFPNGPDDPHAVTVTCGPIWIELWSLMRGVAPAPLGLNSVRLTRKDGGWQAHQTFPTAGEPAPL